MQIWILLVFTCLIVLGFLIYYQNNPVKTGGSEKSHVIKPKGFVIAHLAGSSGVGKTYQAEKLAKEYKDVVFADLDEILEKVPKTKKGFLLNAKTAIENFIAGQTNIILVGYNDYTIENIHYWIDIPTVNRFFLKDDKDSILKRRVDRFKKLQKIDPTAKQVMSWLEEMKNDEKLYEEKLYNFVKLDKLFEAIDYQVKMYRKKQELVAGAWNPVIIHVTGPPGSGKTTLMNSLKNTLTNSDVYDSDTIFYEQIRYIMKKYPNLYKEFIDGKNDKFWDKVWLDGYQERFFKLVDKAVTAKHNIIILGITIELALIADCKYIIDLAPEENFRRRNLREVKKICDNREGVEELLKNAKLPDAVYKIFMDYDHHGAVIGAPNKEIKSMNEIRKVSQDRGYKLLPTADIEHAIKKTLQPEEL